MFPAHRLRLIIARSLYGVPPPGKPGQAEGDLHDYLLESYIRPTCTNERLMDLLMSFSSLGVATQEDWLRLKKICFAHIHQLPCRTVNRIFVLLVENDACSQVECVKLQTNLAQPDFSRTFRNHERLQALRSIAYSGSRLSPTFTPYALDAIQHLVKECQVELLPTLSYSVGRLLTSNEEKGISSEVQRSILDALLARVEGMEYTALALSELIYLLWVLSAFFSSMEPIRPMYLRASTSIMTRGFQLDELKGASPRDLLLLLCSLCPLFSLSEFGASSASNQEEWLTKSAIVQDSLPCGISQVFFKKLLATFDSVVCFLVHHVVSGELQNTNMITTALEMITYSGVTKVLKNAQILSHLLMRTLLYDGRDAWFGIWKDFPIILPGKDQQPLVNFYLFNGKVDFLDRLATRLSFSIHPSVSVHGLEKASMREVVALLEALVYSNLSLHFKRMYLEASLRRVQSFVRSASKDDFLRLSHAIKMLGVNNSGINHDVQVRAHELGLQDNWTSWVTTQQPASHKGGTRETSGKKWNSDKIALCICEKAIGLLGKAQGSVDDLPELVKDLSKQQGLGGATEACCVSTIESLSTRCMLLRENELYRTAINSLFTRVEIGTHINLLLSLIIDGAEAGVSRTVLLDCLLYVGTQLLEKRLKGTILREVASYFVVAHELDVLDAATHPHLLAVLWQEDLTKSICSQLAPRLFGALCALGVDDKSRLGILLTLATPWCLKTISNDVWSEKDWKAALVLIHSLWTPSSEIVKEQLLQLAWQLVPIMIKQSTNNKKRDYFLCTSAAAATLFVCDERFGSISVNIFGEELYTKVISGFLDIVTSLFSEDGATLSLQRVNVLLTSNTILPIIPQFSSILCILITAHAVQRFTLTNNNLSRNITSLGISLWRYCLRYMEKAPLVDDALMYLVGFSIRFGASSRSFDHFMSYMMEKKGSVNMLFVCSVAEGLLQTGKRRSIATQFVAHSIQRGGLDDLPAAALLSLLIFLSRETVKVALGLPRADMLVALLWSSLRLKLDRLPCTKGLWELVDTVPVNVAPSLLQLLGNNELINMSSAAELLRPVSIILTWQTKAVSSTLLSEFLRKVEASLDKQAVNEALSDMAERDLRGMISKHFY